MTESDDTPPVRQLTDEERMAHFDDYPPGTPPVEHRLDARLVRVERENETLRREVASLAASRDTGRKLMWLVIPALVGALATVLLYAADKIAESSRSAGKMEATVDGLKERANKQDALIGQLVEILLRRGAILEPHKPTSDDADRLWHFDDKVTALDQRASTPASRTRSSGPVALQLPKLQNLHTGKIPRLHSRFEEHGWPHVLGGGGAGLATPDGDELQAVRATATTNTILHIPHL